MADEGHEFALLEELARERQHLGVAAQFVRHETAGHEQAAEILAARVGQQQITRGGITVLAGVGAEFGRGHAHGVALLLQTEQGIPQFQILVEVIHERKQRLRHG